MCMGLTEVMDPELQEGKDGANKHTYWVARHGTAMHTHTFFVCILPMRSVQTPDIGCMWRGCDGSGRRVGEAAGGDEWAAGGRPQDQPLPHRQPRGIRTSHSPTHPNLHTPS